MGLPIWRNPDERSSHPKNVATDPTACLRSSIRRRPSIHGRRNTRLPRDHSVLPPRFERSPPPSVGFNGLRESRRGEERGVPPISRLLEAADRPRDNATSARAPPPAPETRFYRDSERERRTFEDTRDATGRLTALDELHRRRALLELRHRARRSEWRSQTSLEIIDLSDGEDTELEGNRALRRSPTPPANRDDLGTPMRTVVLNPGEPLRILRSPESMHTRHRPDSRDGASARRSTLPTPPLDASGPEDGLFVPESDPAMPRPGIRRSHPLSNSWRPDSPVNGLGDRDRSPESADAWEIMRTTITPDESLPSAESSFASAAASHSFNASSNNTQITEPDSSRNSGDDSGSDTSSSVNLDDVCTEEEVLSTEAFAEDIYNHETSTPEGRERIAHHYGVRAAEGNRFALASEPPHVDIGFRLIEEALESEEGRRRVFEMRRNSPEDRRRLEDMLAATHRVRERRTRARRVVSEARTRISQRLDGLEEPSGDRARPMDGYPERRPQNHSQEIRDAARIANGQVQDYFRRFATDALETHANPRAVSPPPQYDVNTQDETPQISHDGPEPHPVSPPSNRSEREVSEALLSGDVQDLDSMRRVVERLAARDDVPEEWWMSMGLNLSRARPRDRSPRRRTVLAGPDDTASTGSRVRTGRIERHDRGNNARL